MRIESNLAHDQSAAGTKDSAEFTQRSRAVFDFAQHGNQKSSVEGIVPEGQGGGIAPTTLAHTVKAPCGQAPDGGVEHLLIHSGACRGQIGPIRLAQSRRATRTRRKATS